MRVGDFGLATMKTSGNEARAAKRESGSSFSSNSSSEQNSALTSPVMPTFRQPTGSILWMVCGYTSLSLFPAQMNGES